MPGAPTTGTPPLLPDGSRLLRPYPARSGVQWSKALPGAALAGVFSLLALVIPYAIFGPAFMMGGALAVLLYRRNLGGAVPAPGAGAKIGAASGGFGFLFSAVMAIATLVYRPAEVRQGMLDNLSQMVGRGYDPQKVAQVQDLHRDAGRAGVFCWLRVGGDGGGDGGRVEYWRSAVCGVGAETAVAVGQLFMVHKERAEVGLCAGLPACAAG